MTTDTKQTIGVYHHRQQGALASVGHFLRHFLEMILAMVFGMAIWGLLFRTFLAGSDFGDMVRAYPELKFGLMSVFMAVPMVWLMRYRRHSWGRSTEMVAAMVAPTAVVVLCARLEMGTYIPLFSDQAMPASAHVAMVLGMLLLMLYRRKEYSHTPSHISGSHTAP